MNHYLIILVLFGAILVMIPFFIRYQQKVLVRKKLKIMTDLTERIKFAELQLQTGKLSEEKVRELEETIRVLTEQRDNL